MSATDSPRDEAIARLRSLFDDARQRGLAEAGTAALATASTTGRPSVRTVSIATIGDDGPLFFINRRSGKGRQIEANPAASMCFFWPELYRQVIVEGEARRLDDGTANHHWSRRPHDARLAAWAAEPDADGTGQLAPEERMKALRRQFDDRPVPRPADWLLLSLLPDVVQFWRLDWRRPQARERYAIGEDGNWYAARVGTF